MGEGVQSVERALDVLEALGRADEAAGVPHGLSELVADTGLPLATVHRLLGTLAGRGYVRQDPLTRKYVLGPAVLRLHHEAAGLLGTWARPVLATLAEVSGETANLAVLDDDHVLYVAQVMGPRRLRMFTQVGNRVLPHTNAVGKALLARRPRAEVERVLARHGLPARTPQTITDPARFLVELDRVAAAGYAVDDGEEEEGVRCLAVPIPASGPAVAAMSVSGPAVRLGREQRERLLPRMRDLAAEVATLAAGRDDPQGPGLNGR